MKNTENTEIVNIPENYRKAIVIQDFNIGDVVYMFADKPGIGKELIKGTVKDILRCSPDNRFLVISWDGYVCSSRYSCSEYIERIYVQDKTKRDKPNKPKFKVGDRVIWNTEYNNMKGTVVVTSSCRNMLHVLWDATESSPSYVNAYTNDQQEFINIIPKEESRVTEKLTIDLKLHFNLDTSGIETVLIDCVKATVTNGKYQEAKELCELLLSVQSLGESKDATSKTT